LIWGATIGLLINANRFFRIFFDLDCEKSKNFFAAYHITQRNIKPKIFKYRKQVENITVFIQDFFLVIIYVIGLLIINFSFNKGNFRLFSIPVSIIGFLMFKFTIGKILFSISEWIAIKVKIGIIVIFHFVYTPILYISTKICEFCKKNYVFLKISIAKQIKKRYNNNKEKHLNKFAGSAFVKFDNFLK
jgi:hypothetical protein